MQADYTKIEMIIIKLECKESLWQLQREHNPGAVTRMHNAHSVLSARKMADSMYNVHACSPMVDSMYGH